MSPQETDATRVLTAYDQLVSWHRVKASLFTGGGRGGSALILSADFVQKKWAMPNVRAKMNRRSCLNHPQRAIARMSTNLC
jgi:hypothetical protein